MADRQQLELRKDREPPAVHAVQHEHDPDANDSSPMHDPDVLPHIFARQGDEQHI